MKKTLLCPVTLLFVACAANEPSGNAGSVTTPITRTSETTGIWTSRAELAAIPMSGHEWDLVLSSANSNTSNPDVGNQNDNTNCYVLAAAIASERYYAAGEDATAERYRNKVVTALEKIIDTGWPEGTRSLAWGREIGAYAMAADLIGYRTQAFEDYLYGAVHTWICSERNESLLRMSQRRPNNWGTMGFGTLCAVFTYLQDWDALNDIRARWVSTLEGPSHKDFKYNKDLTWQGDESMPLVINHAGAMKEGMSIDGFQPEEMRRGDSFANPPAYTEYPFEALQGWIMAARILDRQGLSIWETADRALYRAVYGLQVYLNQNYGDQWSFANDDLWILGFIDGAYGSNFVEMAEVDTRGFGKNTGYTYVVQGDRR